MNNLNVNFKQIAESIAAKLDAKDTGGKNGFIEASIWNEFVGGGANQQHVGNGDKSKITNQISIADAVKSITSYIQKKGVDVVYKSLNAMGISCEQNSDVSTNAVICSNREADAQEATEIKEYLQQQGYEFEEIPRVDLLSIMANKKTTTTLERRKEVLNAKGDNGYNYVTAKSTITELQNKAIKLWKQQTNEDGDKYNELRFFLANTEDADPNIRKSQKGEREKRISSLSQKAIGALSPEDQEIYKKANEDIEQLKSKYGKEIDLCIHDLNIEVYQKFGQRN